MSEQVPSNEAAPQVFVNRARVAPQQIVAERAQLDALLQNPPQEQQKELDLSDPPGFDEEFRGTTYR
jgi:hypothetical protein